MVVINSFHSLPHFERCNSFGGVRDDGVERVGAECARGDVLVFHCGGHHSGEHVVLMSQIFKTDLQVAASVHRADTLKPVCVSMLDAGTSSHCH